MYLRQIGSFLKMHSSIIAYLHCQDPANNMVRELEFNYVRQSFSQTYVSQPFTMFWNVWRGFYNPWEPYVSAHVQILLMLNNIRWSLWSNSYKNFNLREKDWMWNPTNIPRWGGSQQFKTITMEILMGDFVLPHVVWWLQSTKFNVGYWGLVRCHATLLGPHMLCTFDQINMVLFLTQPLVSLHDMMQNFPCTTPTPTFPILALSSVDR